MLRDYVIRVRKSRGSVPLSIKTINGLPILVKIALIHPLRAATKVHGQSSLCKVYDGYFLALATSNYVTTIDHFPALASYDVIGVSKAVGRLVSILVESVDKGLLCFQ